ncbi:response regulator [Arenibaculum pallidiluteum]|uniref:response regulator n=1 Tax=Arenibaculum pallidiluteum TaxID=2812559 RepID=UPI001A9629D5|nr:response regulator [Arenibaculum pallidiluteum]
MADSSAEVVKQLPYLRRYARALLGSQDRGDRYVRVTLETYLAEPERIGEADRDSRVALFSLFHDVWSLIDPEGALGDDPDDLDAGGVRGLASLPPRQRQVLLLISLEGFSFDEVSRILGMEPSEIRVDLDRARSEMAAVGNVRVLIIEDEPLIAEDIADLVTGWGHEVIGQAAREEEARRLAEEGRPELILADIQLKGGDSGIRAVQQILRSTNVPVIFITGFPERLLTGEQLEPAFLISKPFEPEVLKTAIGHALTIQPPRTMN